MGGEGPPARTPKNEAPPAPRPTHVSELHKAQLAQLAHTGVGSTCGQEELDQRHLLTPEHGAHGPVGRREVGAQAGAGHRGFLGR